MALNSCITPDGLEMGRAQAVQAFAAGKQPDVRMNPILLKPSSDIGSQLIVNGRVRGQYAAKDYFGMKKNLIPDILEAYHSLAKENDVIVIEGAGSPAEINLRENDIVNMGLAALVNAPVILAGDIDRGGVFAQLYGTMALLEQEEKRRVIGTVINKFRGDLQILKPGLDELEKLTGVPVLGVVPYTRVRIDDEDSLSDTLSDSGHDRPVDIAIIRLPRISNFTDFAPLTYHPSLGIRYVGRHQDLRTPDLIILPGTKSTMEDLRYLRESGLESAILRCHKSGTPILGICGGYQMLGETLEDPCGVEGAGEMAGMGLLPCRTIFEEEKTRRRMCAVTESDPIAGARLEGYEIHMGATIRRGGEPFARLQDGREDGTVCHNVFGTYLHGLFDTGELTDILASWLLAKKGIASTDGASGTESHESFQERQINRLADQVREALDMETIRRAMEEYAT